MFLPLLRRWNVLNPDCGVCVCVFSHSAVSSPSDPRDWSPPGSSVHGLSQLRVLEWVAISSPGGSSRPGIRPGSCASFTAGGFFTADSPRLHTFTQIWVKPKEPQTQKRASFTIGKILRNSHAEGERGLLLSTESLC